MPFILASVGFKRNFTNKNKLFLKQSLTKAIIFELFYYINGYIRVYVVDIHEYSFKMPYLPIILINFSWAKSHNFFIMEKSKFTLLFNIC